MSVKYDIPQRNALLGRVILEAVAILVLVYPMLHIYVFLQGELEPVKRGFYCDDESIKHPNKKEEISVVECFIIFACIVLLIVPSVELLHVTIFDHGQNPKVGNIPWVFIELYRILGYFGFGALCTLLTTEMAKYKIGRLRPYFLTVCQISLTEDLCKDENKYNKFVTDYTCPGDAHEVREAMKSFLSGHSSFSFYSATFLIVYLHARLANFRSNQCKKSYTKLWMVFRGLKVLRPFLQFGIFSLAFYIALTRINDYKHHPGDVITGMLVGIFFATIILLFLMDLFHRPRIFKAMSIDTLLEGGEIVQMKTRSEPNLRGGNATTNNQQASLNSDEGTLLEVEKNDAKAN